MERKENGNSIWMWGILTVVVLIAAFAFQPKLDVEILDTQWTAGPHTIEVTSVVKNNTDRDLRVTIEYLADHHRHDQYDRALTFAGRTQLSLAVPAQRASEVSATIPRTRNTGPSILVTPTLLEIAPADPATGD